MSSPPSEIQVQNVGETVRLNCSAGGSPLPKVTWLKDRRHITTTSVNSGNDLISSEFVIFHFKKSDAGIYTCVFYNERNVTAETKTSLGMSKRKHYIRVFFMITKFSCKYSFLVSFQITCNDYNSHYVL